MTQFQSSHTVDSLDLEEEEQPCIQINKTPLFFSDHVTFNKHPEEVGQVEIAEQYLEDTVQG